MLKKELLLSGSSKKKPMMKFTIEDDNFPNHETINVELNDGTGSRAWYSITDYNWLDGKLTNNPDMTEFKIFFSSHDEDETCMSPENPYYDKGQTLIIYDKDLNEIARTTYPYNCGYFYVEPIKIPGLVYYNLMSDKFGYLDTFPPPTQLRAIGNPLKHLWRNP